MLGSVTSYLLTRAEILDVQRATVWLTGSLNGRGWEHVRPVITALVVLVPLAAGLARHLRALELGDDTARSEEHTSELQSLMRISYAVFCLKKKHMSFQSL